jgi:hypothetical protein
MGGLIKRWIPILVFAVIPGLIVLSGYLLPTNEMLVGLRHYLVECAVIVAAFAFLLGVFNILRVHGSNIRRREHGWPYSILLLLAMLITVLPPILQGILTARDVIQGQVFDSEVREMLVQSSEAVFRYLISPLGASVAALLVFTLSLAAFRLLRARRNAGTVLFLAIVVLVLLGSTPLLGLGWLAVIRDWIVNVPAMAGTRGLLLGVAIGSVITGLRVLLTLDRPYTES